MNLIKRLWHEEEGQDLTEYALLLVLIALALVTTIPTFAAALKSIFTNATNALSTTP